MKYAAYPCCRKKVRSYSGLEKIEVHSGCSPIVFRFIKLPIILANTSESQGKNRFGPGRQRVIVPVRAGYRPSGKPGPRRASLSLCVTTTKVMPFRRLTFTCRSQCTASPGMSIEATGRFIGKDNVRGQDERHEPRRRVLLHRLRVRRDDGEAGHPWQGPQMRLPLPSPIRFPGSGPAVVSI